MRTIALLLLIFCTGCEVYQAQPDQAGAAVLLTQATLATNDATPTPTPDNGECANCNGIGWTGDGRTWMKCLVCNEDGSIPRPGAAQDEAAVVPTTQPVIWHDNLASALMDHEQNGGMLAVIIGGEGCIPCEKRLAEAKALKSSPYSWVYCKQGDPALSWMDLSEEETKKVPMFVTVIGPVVDHRVKPETLGLLKELPQ
jgi:hypothetical protein